MRENKHIKILKKTTWNITLFSIGFIIFLHILNPTISYDDWQGILGGYVGSLVGGIATLIAVIFTLKDVDDERTQKEILEKKKRVPILKINSHNDEFRTGMYFDRDYKKYVLLISNVTDNIALINHINIKLYDFILDDNKELYDFINYKMAKKYAFLDIKQLKAIGSFQENFLTKIVTKDKVEVFRDSEITMISPLAYHEEGRCIIGEIYIGYTNMMDEHYLQQFKIAIDSHGHVLKITMPDIPQEVLKGKKGIAFHISRECDEYKYNKREN